MNELEQNRKCKLCDNNLKKNQKSFCSHRCATTYNNSHRIVSDETKRKMSENRKGEKNSFYGKTHSDEQKEKWSKQRKNRRLTDEWRKNIGLSQKGKKLSEETKKKMSIAKLNDKNIRIRNTGERNPFYGKKHSEETLKKLRGRKNSEEVKRKMSIIVSELIASGNRKPLYKSLKKGYYTSTKSKETNHYDSSFELIRMKFLDNNVNIKNWTKNHKIIIGLNNGRRYIPDFLVELTNGEKYLEEVKGWIGDKEEFALKSNAAIEYCKKNNLKYRVLFKEDLEIL